MFHAPTTLRIEFPESPLGSKYIAREIAFLTHVVGESEQRKLDATLRFGGNTPNMFERRLEYLASCPNRIRRLSIPGAENCNKVLASGASALEDLHLRAKFRAIDDDSLNLTVATAPLLRKICARPGVLLQQPLVDFIPIINTLGFCGWDWGEGKPTIRKVLEKCQSTLTRLEDAVKGGSTPANRFLQPASSLPRIQMTALKQLVLPEPNSLNLLGILTCPVVEELVLPYDHHDDILPTQINCLSNFLNQVDSVGHRFHTRSLKRLSMWVGVSQQRIVLSIDDSKSCFPTLEELNLEIEIKDYLLSSACEQWFQSFSKMDLPCMRTLRLYLNVTDLIERMIIMLEGEVTDLEDEVTNQPRDYALQKVEEACSAFIKKTVDSDGRLEEVCLVYKDRPTGDFLDRTQWEDLIMKRILPETIQEKATGSTIKTMIEVVPDEVW